jgi:Neutral/alkaline non-lysosomal ceramidase, N-terminal
MHKPLSLIAAVFVSVFLYVSTAAADTLRLATFQIDITPPIGAPLCDALVVPAESVDDPLSARGIVLLGAGQPIVLCALDWVGVGNAGYDVFREALARAAGTETNRVALHAIHQHDAPGCDFEADALLASAGLQGQLFDVVFARTVIDRLAKAVKEAVPKAEPLTHFGYGRGKVEEVASNRRVLGPDGRVKYTRYSATRDPAVRAEPEGVIDPDVRLLAFWNGDRCLAVLTYYATHPQSYYGTGHVSADFPGLARTMREQAVPGVRHIHFNGAGGNVTAGKYNDGAKENRARLAQRLAAGMQAAWESAVKTPVSADDIAWNVVPVVLPAAPKLNEEELRATIANTGTPLKQRLQAGRHLAWLLRCQANHPIDVACLKLGSARVLQMPGELFVEYELAAQQMRPGQPVLMAAYGDYGPGYIGTKIAYTQGGYETSVVSRVAPEAEEALLKAMTELLR